MPPLPPPKKKICFLDLSKCVYQFQLNYVLLFTYSLQLRNVRRRGRTSATDLDRRAKPKARNQEVVEARRKSGNTKTI